MNQLKDFIHFHLGCEVDTGDDSVTPATLVNVGLLGSDEQRFLILRDFFSVRKPFDFKYHKLLLRPLISLKKSQAIELINLSGFGLPILEIITITNLGIYFKYGSFEMDKKLTMSFDELHPLQFAWLLKNDFNLFDPTWKYCIDKTTLNK